MACVQRAPDQWYARRMKKPTREARIGIKAFDSEEEAWREAARQEGMDLSAWARRAMDRAKVAEERERKARERWY